VLAPVLAPVLAAVLQFFGTAFDISFSRSFCTRPVLKANAYSFGMQKGQPPGELWPMMATLISAVLIAVDCPSSAMIQA
jgi:hypothetical protein